jgi:hypothetical protein
MTLGVEERMSWFGEVGLGGGGEDGLGGGEICSRLWRRG